MKADPQWELLLDLDALAASDGEDWIWRGASIEPERREKAVLRLSRGGSDAVVHREFDLSSLSFVADGFNLPEAKGDIDWLDPNTLLLSSALGRGMATRSGYARTVRLWKRGADPLTARPGPRSPRRSFSCSISTPRRLSALSNAEAQSGEFRRIRPGGRAPRGSLDRS
ncbi:hypothetical protein MesoLj131a_61690 [Mesorhizobium sp. 131-2-1]|nr:hypothetical protein MesoLj131a_61690 [Mesorhizobium sp. 131-2-1]BCH04376.1 hypothetical protein MesoLj131b_63750 [Mesorhizobium sp. 131-2-5]